MVSVHQPIQLLVLQGTPFCNIDCSYCYLPSRNDRSRMPEAVLEATIDRVVESGLLGQKLSIIWHAGEPLALPLTYYENAVALIERRLRHLTDITYRFQTNGTLVDEQWCQFFGRTRCKVGLSIDGPRPLHNLHRVTRRGAGTFDKAAAGLRRLVETEVDLHVISVLTRESLFFPDEFYRFYVDYGVRHVCFNAEQIEGVNKHSSLEDRRCEELFSQFFQRFLELVSAGRSINSVREFDHAFAALLRPPMSERAANLQVEPYVILSVSTNGDFSTYSPELLGMKDRRWGDFVLGNVFVDSLEQTSHSPKFKSLHQEIKDGVARCRSVCEFFEACGGGTPANKLYETGCFDSAETLYCRYSVKQFMQLALEAVERSCGLSGGAPRVSV